MNPRDWLLTEALREVRRDPITFLVLLFALTAVVIAFLFAAPR